LGLATFLANTTGLNLNKTLYYRDAIVYLFTLTLITFFLMDNIIDGMEAVILVLMYPIYLYISIKFSAEDSDDAHTDIYPIKLK
jgi:Ca2+/Na+ antiporter